MALIKKCNLCSEKGLFLKLTNGLCENCNIAIENLENDYTKILQKIALSPDDKKSAIEDLNILISKAEPFDGISGISISTYKTLLETLSKPEINTKESDKAINDIKNIDNTEEIIIKKEPLPITEEDVIPIIKNEDKAHSLKDNPVSNIETSDDSINNLDELNESSIKPINLEFNSVKTPNLTDIKNHSTSTIDIEDFTLHNTPQKKITKIKNLIEPVLIEDISNNDISSEEKEEEKKEIKDKSITTKTPKTLKLNIKASNLTKSTNSSTINANKNLSINKNKDSSVIEVPSLKEAFILNNLKKKCSSLSSKLDDPNTSIDVIAENYFYIKNELLKDLNNNSNLLEENHEIQNSLDNAKNTLCVRSKKTEDELFNFFNYVSIFVQTTGLSPQNSDIIEISAVKISYGKIIDEFYSLVNPIKSIKLSVTNATGISNEDVENKPTIDMIAPSLMEFLGDYQLVSFNPKPVELFLNSTLKKLNMKLINTQSISVRSLYRIRYKNYHGYPPTLSDLSNTCIDLLTESEIESINNFKSQSKSTSYAVYKLYEILKYRYK